MSNKFKINQDVEVCHSGFSSDLQQKINGKTGKVVGLMTDENGSCFGYIVQIGDIWTGFPEKSLK